MIIMYRTQKGTQFHKIHQKKNHRDLSFSLLQEDVVYVILEVNSFLSTNHQYHHRYYSQNNIKSIAAKRFKNGIFFSSNKMKEQIIKGNQMELKAYMLGTICKK